MNSKKTGKTGEDTAVKYLEIKGYKILQRNFERKISRFLKSEIDIVAKKGDIISFVEVKTLKSPVLWQNPGFFPEEKVDFRKRKKLVKTAESWLIKNKIPFDTKWQIDIISVILDLEGRQLKISHFENAVEW